MVASPEQGVSWALEGECKEKGSAAYHQAGEVREGTQGGGDGGLEKHKTACGCHSQEGARFGPTDEGAPELPEPFCTCWGRMKEE